MAQPGSALAWGARGPEFESRQPDQIPQQLADSRSFGSAFLESNWSPKWTPAEFRGRHSSTSGTREFQTRILRGFLFLQKPNKSAQKPGKPSSVSSSSDSLCSGEAAGLLTMAERPPLASGGEAHRDAGSRAVGPWAENPPTHFGRADCPDHCQHRRLWAQQSDPGRHQRRHHRRSRPRPR